MTQGFGEGMDPPPSEQTLEGKCFSSGYNLMGVPPESEPFNREFYNLGLEVYKIHNKLELLADRLIYTCQFSKLGIESLDLAKKTIEYYQDEIEKTWQAYKKIQSNHPKLNKDFAPYIANASIGAVYQKVQDQLKLFNVFLLDSEKKPRPASP